MKAFDKLRRQYLNASKGRRVKPSRRLIKARLLGREMAR